VRVATVPRSLVVVLEFLVVTLGPSLPCRRVSIDTAVVRPGLSINMIVACRAVLMEKSRLSASLKRCGSRRRGCCREMAGHLLRPSLSDSLPFPQTPLIQTCCDKHPRRCESVCCWGTMPCISVTNILTRLQRHRNTVATSSSAKAFSILISTHLPSTS
jgi:hypothetical protein